MTHASILVEIKCIGKYILIGRYSVNNLFVCLHGGLAARPVQVMLFQSGWISIRVLGLCKKVKSGLERISAKK